MDENDQENDQDDRPKKRAICRDCRYPMTWDQQRRQFGRLMQKGFTVDEAKAALPRCQKCLTLWLHADDPRWSFAIWLSRERA